LKRFATIEVQRTKWSDAMRREMGVLAFAAASCLAALTAGCGAKQAAGNLEPAATPVKTIVVRPVPISDSSEYLATLKSRHSTALNPLVEGQVTQIFVKSGDRVEKSTRLMEIDPLKQQATVESQEAARAAQEANVRFARVQWERAQKLYAAGVTSKQDFDQAKTNLDSAEQQLKALEEQVKQQKVELHYYSVVAPTTGIVGDNPVRVGDRVTFTTLLTTVDEPGSLQLYVNVPVEHSKELRKGQTVQLLDPGGKVLAESQIDFISAEVDNTTQSILVKADIQNSSGALRTSQFARARIIWGVHEGPMLPVLAVSRVSGQFFVFVVEGSGKSQVAHQRMLRLGEVADNQYPVLEGLKAGDHVVVEGAQSLTEGTLVTETVQDAAAKPSR